jgi:hypothetical protein
VRWLVLALSAVCLSTGAVLLSVSLFVVSESALSERSGEESAAKVQYRVEAYSDYAEQPRNATPAPLEVQSSPETDYSRWLAQEIDAAQNSQVGSSGSVSEGTISGASAPAEDLSIMEPSASYSRVVDNASAGWFLARGWQKSAGSKAQLYGKDFSYVEPSEVGPPRSSG